ncbi:MAG: PLP-dependent aminotransferase family protein [Thermomicrobiales bacterium]|nr:PLP-dependent aminotransferase family protein [Thermomicrobiales bacterium]
MSFSLQPDSDMPLYKQIGEGLRREIASGAIQAETRLPSSRQLARDLAVSRITVANAYADLIADGVVEARPGAGTFVLPPWPLAGSTHVVERQSKLPAWQTALQTQIDPERDRMMRQVLRGPMVADTIPFAWGAGDPRIVPTAEFRRAMTEVLDEDGAAALGPEQADGYLPLRANLTHYLRQIGLDVAPEEILITAGTQQAISMVTATLVQPGDRVVVELPTWPGALDAFTARGAEIVGVRMDAEGMSATHLRQILEREQPRLIYTVPTFQNPTGIVMSAARRRQIVDLAERYGVPIFEDDHVREVRFGSPIPPPLAAFDRNGNVIHASSFTKSLIPALRLGYVVARGPLREWLMSLKRTSDLFSSTLMQRALSRYLEQGSVQRHWLRISRTYRRRHTAMLDALARHFPAEATWSGVAGGLVLWVGMPPGVSVAELFDAAIREGVSFVAGAAFFPEPNDQPFLRLNFAAIDEARIEHGIAILGNVLTRHLGAQPHHARAPAG